jgi:hydrogenase 3 maturation protease
LNETHTLLHEFLCGATRVAVLGAGSVLRGDDAAGMVLFERLAEHFEGMDDVRCFPGETAPENYSGSIRRFSPSHLIVADAADFDHPAGQIFAIDPNDVGGLSCCTHMLPLKVMLNYLVQETGTRLLLLGIQPQSMEFEEPLTDAVASAVDELYNAIVSAVEEHLKTE